MVISLKSNLKNCKFHMAPHPCELNMKTILTDKAFSPQAYLKSGFHQFLENVIAYLNEFNREQETGFFKKAKYVDGKSLNACMKKIFQVAGPGTLRTDDIQLLDKIFCVLLHPKTPQPYFMESLENYLCLLSVINDHNISDLEHSSPLIVPYFIVAKPEDMALYNASIYAYTCPIIDPSQPYLSAQDTSKALEMVLEFIFKNWSIREGLCLNLFFNCIVKLIYKSICDKNSVQTFDYGFTVLPSDLHRCVITFLKKILDNYKPLDCLLYTRDSIIMMLSICRTTTYNPSTSDLIVTFNFISAIYEKESTYVLCTKSFDKFQQNIGDLIFEVLSSNCKNNGIIEEPLIVASYDIIFKYLNSLLVKEDFEQSRTGLSKILVTHENEEGAFAHFTHCIVYYLVSTYERRPEIWNFFLKELCRRPIGAAACSLYAQYLCYYSLPKLYKFGAEAVTHSKNFVSRNKRNRQSTVYDFIAENLQLIYEVPHEFVCEKINQILPELNQFDKILENMHLQPLNIPDDKILECIVFFINQFYFYKNLNGEERILGFAPIMAIADSYAKSLLFPPGIEINGTLPFQFCGNQLFSAILDINDDRIRNISFNILSQILNINQMKNYLDDKSLSLWYAALCLQMLSADESMREEGFKQAINTIQHAFTGSLTLIPMMMALVEASFIKTSSQTISFLSSFPLLNVSTQIPTSFVNSVNSIILRYERAYISDPMSFLTNTSGNLRKRAISLIDKYHLIAMKENRMMTPVKSGESRKSNLFELLIPAYSVLISDELTLPNPDSSLIGRFLNYFLDALKLKSLEALVSIRGLLMYISRIASIDATIARNFIGGVSKYCCSVTRNDSDTWVFNVIRLTVDAYIESSAVMKCGQEYNEFISFLNGSLNNFSSEITGFIQRSLQHLAVTYMRYPLPQTQEFMTNRRYFQKGQVDNARYYLVDGIVTGAITDGEKTRISSQTTSGQFVWDFTPIYPSILQHSEPKAVNTFFNVSSPAKIDEPYSVSHQADFSSKLIKQVDRLHSDFNDLAEFDDISNIDKILSDMEVCSDAFNNRKHTTDVEFPKPPIEHVSPVAAIFASTGRVTVNNFKNLKVIENQNQRAGDAIEKVNQLSTRLGTKFGVLFVHNEAVDQNQILSTTFADTSPHFREFITGLGWPVSLKEHRGYFGGLDKKEGRNGRTSIYFANSMHEMMFHIAPLLPNDNTDGDGQQIYKKRHIGNDHVHIIWCTAEKDYNTSTITSQFNQVHIVIYPLQTGLFRVDTFSRNDELWFGPLRNSVVVNKRELPSLVRETAEEAMIVFYMNQSAFQHPLNDVNTNISNINEHYLVPYDNLMFPHAPYVDVLRQK